MKFMIDKQHQHFVLFRFFSDATVEAAVSLAPLVPLIFNVHAGCTESVTLEFFLPPGWTLESSSDGGTLSYSGPRAYGYELTLTLPSESLSTW
jgi:hypothetical protein